MNELYQEHEILCTSCGHDFNETITREDGNKIDMNGSNIICPMCGVSNLAYIDYQIEECGEEYQSIVIEQKSI